MATAMRRWRARFNARVQSTECRLHARNPSPQNPRRTVTKNCRGAPASRVWLSPLAP